MKKISYTKNDTRDNAYTFEFRGTPVHGSVSSFLGDQAIDYMAEFLNKINDVVDIISLQTGHNGLTPGEYCKALIVVKDSQAAVNEDYFDKYIEEVLGA